MDITHNAVLIIRVQIVVWTYVFNSLDIYLRVELMGPIVTLCLTFEELTNSFPKLQHHFQVPPTVYEGFH